MQERSHYDASTMASETLAKDVIPGKGVPRHEENI